MLFKNFFDIPKKEEGIQPRISFRNKANSIKKSKNNRKKSKFKNKLKKKIKI